MGGIRSMSKKDFVVGLDIGTTKICAIVGEVTDHGEGRAPVIDIIGIGTAPSSGLRKGVEINTVYTGIAGGHIKSFNSTGIVAVKGKEIDEQDVQRVIDAAKAVAIPLDREVIHIIPQEYMINGQDGIRDPIGMSGIRLE